MRCLQVFPPNFLASKLRIWKIFLYKRPTDYFLCENLSLNQGLRWELIGNCQLGSAEIKYGALYPFVFFLRLFILFMCMIVLPTCTNVYHMHACAHRCQKQMSHSLELKVQMVVSHQMGARNWAQVLCRNIKCSEQWLLALPLCFFNYMFTVYWWLGLLHPSQKKIILCVLIKLLIQNTIYGNKY